MCLLATGMGRIPLEVVGGFVHGVFLRRVKREKFLEQLGLCDCYRAIGAVS